MIFISKYENSNHFIHKINYEILDDFIKVKKVGFLDNSNPFFDKIRKDDFIIFAIDINKELNLFAYTKVDEVLIDDNSLYNVYKSNKQLKFSKLKFFKEPICDYRFIINNDFEYLDINKEEYKSVIPPKNKLNTKLSINIKYHPDLTIGEFILKTNGFLENSFNVSFENKQFSSDEILSKYGIFLNQNIKNITLSFDEDSRFFVQHVDFSSLDKLKKKMYLNEVENKSEEIKQVKPNDYILLYTTIRNKLYFVSIGKVAYNLFNSFDNFKYFKPENTIKFRIINYFSYITPIRDSNEFNPFNQYVEVSEREINLISKNNKFSENIPTYFDKYDFGDVRKFIVKTGKILFDLIKEFCDVEIFPIKEFLKLLCIFLNYYDFNITYDEIEEFFSVYALKFGFRLTSTRESDLIVELNIRGRKKEVTYLMMNE